MIVVIIIGLRDDCSFCLGSDCLLSNCDEDYFGCQDDVNYGGNETDVELRIKEYERYLEAKPKSKWIEASIVSSLKSELIKCEHSY